MKNKQITFMLVALSFLLVLGFSVQVLAGETYKMGLSLAITGPTSDAGAPIQRVSRTMSSMSTMRNCWAMTSWSASSAMTVTRQRSPNEISKISWMRRSYSI